MNDRRAILADHVDHRVIVTGMFDRCSLNVGSTRQCRTALLQDVFVEVEGKDLDLGHVWVQHAEPIKNLQLAYGDRIRCNCRITTYKKRLQVPNKDGLMVVESYSLSWPTEIEIINRAVRQGDSVLLVAGERPSTDQVPKAPPISVLRELKELANKAGGWDALKEMIDVLNG